MGRDRHLIRHLQTRGHDVATVQWPVREPTGFLAGSFGLKRDQGVIEDTPAYHVRRIPDITRRFRSAPMAGNKLKQLLFHRDIRWALNDFDAEVLITAFSSYMTGYPPFNLDVPVVFDYLDLVNWSNHPYQPDLPYVKQADAVLCVSKAVQDRVEAFNDSNSYLPNGADVNQFRSADGTDIRIQYKLEEKTIVSLIGLNVGSAGLYFIDAILEARREDSTIHGLLVGDSPTVRDRIDALDPERDSFTYIGRVPYEDVAKYYAATDIGLYPAVGGTYDDGRSPIKVFEFSACNIPVVSAPIREVRNLSFGNIFLAEPGVASFADGILAARAYDKVMVPEVERYDWEVLASKLESTIKQLLR